MDVIKIIYPPIIGGAVGAVAALTVEWYRNRLRTLSRYHELQLNPYNTVWNSLYDLQLAGDSLWEAADVYNLGKFTEQLQKTENIINRNALFIEDSHLRELRDLIRTFKNYEFGKGKLIELYKKRIYSQVILHEVREMTRSNEEIKGQYDRLINEIARSFRRHLRRP